MDRLNISPLRGLIDFWFALSYNLFIPSGLQNKIGILLSKICKKINNCSIKMLNRYQENMPATFHFGPKILFDGYLTISGKTEYKTLTINSFLFDSHMIKEKL